MAALGLDVLVSEIDVADQFAPADPEQRDLAVAETYYRILQATLREPATIAVLAWGMSDKYSWLVQDRPRPDRLPVRPLPYDAGMRRKAAWGAIARAIDEVPPRRPHFRG